MKRQEAGDQIFHRLEEHCGRLHALLCEAHARLGLEPPTVAEVTNGTVAPDGGRTMQPALGKRRRSSSTNTHHHDGTNTAAAAADADADADDDDMDIEQPIPQEEQQQPPKKKGATEHIMAASALCQLAGPEDEDEEKEADEPVAITLGYQPTTAMVAKTETAPPQEQSQESAALAAAAMPTVDASRTETAGESSIRDGAAVESPAGMEIK